MLNRRTFLLGPLAIAASSAMTPVVAAQRKPNIILIVATSWPGWAVPWAGNTQIVTPNLAELAREGVSFTRAYACCSRSDRARLCLTKGVFPHMLAGTDASAEALAAEAPSITSILNRAGYRTGQFDGLQVDDVISFMHTPASQPFYAEWTFDSNAARLMDRVALDDIQLRSNVPSLYEHDAKLALSTFYARAHTRDLDIGLVLRAIDRPGLAENTIVVFTSDHGEQLLSHGLDGHDYPFEESMHVPLAVRVPGRPGAKQISALVSLADIVPSLLNLCGVTAPETVQGTDLSGLLTGTAQTVPDSVYGEGRMGMQGEWRMVLRGFDKLVSDREGNAVHLYNLAEDPQENNNLSDASSQELKRDSLLALQKVWARKLRDGVDSSGLKTR